MRTWNSIAALMKYFRLWIEYGSSMQFLVKYQVSDIKCRVWFDSLSSIVDHNTGNLNCIFMFNKYAKVSCETYLECMMYDIRYCGQWFGFWFQQLLSIRIKCFTYELNVCCRHSVYMSKFIFENNDYLFIDCEYIVFDLKYPWDIIRLKKWILY